MKSNHFQLAAALDSLKESIAKADNAFELSAYTDDEWERDSAEWHAHVAFTQLLLIAEVLELAHLRSEVAEAYASAKKTGILDGSTGPDGEPHLTCLGVARRFVRAIELSLVVEPSQVVTKDLESILRGCQYAVTDKYAFSSAPQNEEELHRRIESVLRCVFTDLRHKPPLSKPIKNFIPDTGLPALQTLIEYKFLSSAKSVPTIADEILADTRGYHSSEWSSFVFVIYETARFRPETEWRRFLRDNGVPESTTVVVLSGEPVPSTKTKKKGAKRTSAKKGITKLAADKRS